MDIQFPNAIQVGGRAYAVRGRGGAGGGHSSIEQKNTRHCLRIVETASRFLKSLEISLKCEDGVLHVRFPTC
jgi:hypothetical protein